MGDLKRKLERYLAPLFSAIIAALLILIFGIFYFKIFSEIPGVGYVGYIFIGIALVAVGVTAAVLVQRIREIKRGEEDDLGKY